jgi:hypothetical protein
MCIRIVPHNQEAFISDGLYLTPDLENYILFLYLMFPSEVNPQSIMVGQDKNIHDIP